MADGGPGFDDIDHKVGQLQLEIGQSWLHVHTTFGHVRAKMAKARHKLAKDWPLTWTTFGRISAGQTWPGFDGQKFDQIAEKLPEVVVVSAGSDF